MSPSQLNREALKSYHTASRRTTGVTHERLSRCFQLFLDTISAALGKVNLFRQETESPRHRTASGGPPPFGKGGFSVLDVPFPFQRPPC